MGVTVICAGVAVSVWNLGGILSNHAARVDDWTVRECIVQIEGDCKSACTMYTSVPNACIRPEAQLWFHRPTPVPGSGLTEHAVSMGALFWSRYLPPGMAEWWLGGPSESREWTVVTGAEVIRVGWMNECL